MEIAELSDRLDRARRAVAEGDTNIRHQHDLIAHLKRAGADTSQARVVLDALLKRQAQRHHNLAVILRQIPPER